MQNRRLWEMIFKRDVFYRIGLVIFGLTFFPGIIFLFRNLFFASNAALSTSYTAFYGSLLDFSVEGMISWSIACVPYFAYDVFLMIKDKRTKESETVEK